MRWSGMKDLTRHAYRVYNAAVEIAEANARMLEVLAKSAELLKAPLPDTFLGRPNHDPIPFPNLDD